MSDVSWTPILEKILFQAFHSARGTLESAVSASARTMRLASRRDHSDGGRLLRAGFFIWRRFEE